MPYETQEEAKMRLEGTVVMYDERPCFVREIIQADQDLVARLNPMPRMRDDLPVNIKDEKLVARGLRLGYVNYGARGVVYVERMPVRRYKQGICRDNLYFKLHNNPGVGNNQRDYWQALLGRKEFTDMLVNAYPSVDKCIDELNAGGDKKAAAFAREFALEKDELGLFFLYHKGNKVAWGEPTTGYTLPSEYMYLREVLQEAGIEVR
jgi:hypothetical protein